MKIRISFRTLAQLFNAQIAAGAVPNVGPLGVVDAGRSLLPGANLTNVELWATYAIVSNQERKRMACAPRDILIEQVQVFNHQPFNVSAANFANQYDVRFSQAIKLLFFGVLNQTSSNGTGEVGMCNRSNYTSRQPLIDPLTNTLDRENGFDPVAQTTLFYENTVRLAAMGSDYFSLVCPWYTAPSIPDVTGFHLYSYSLDFMCLDPLGSTNYGKLTNISLRCTTSRDAAAAGSTPPAAGTAMNVPNTFLFVASAINNNIIRISGGALGFPVL